MISLCFSACFPAYFAVGSELAPQCPASRIQGTESLLALAMLWTTCTCKSVPASVLQAAALTAQMPHKLPAHSLSGTQESPVARSPLTTSPTTTSPVRERLLSESPARVDANRLIVLSALRCLLGAVLFILLCLAAAKWVDHADQRGRTHFINESSFDEEVLNESVFDELLGFWSPQQPRWGDPPTDDRKLPQ